MCKQDDIADCVYIVYQGEIAVIRNNLHIVTFTKGELFGTQALDNKTQRSASKHLNFD